MDSQDAISAALPSATCVTSFSRQSTATTQSSESRTPFEKHVELHKNLDFTLGTEKLYRLQSHGSTQTLPDAPRVRLDCPSMILSHCLDDLDTPSLNKLGRKLWWAAPTPEIVSLSQQMVLDRRIQITEDPSVHMLWVEGIIYVKPLPAYLTSHAWWEWLSDSSNTDLNVEEKERLRATSLGFLRTYARLIQRRSDFSLARRHELLGQTSVISFEDFIAFISSFDSIPESSVSSRWRYGLLQLDALNFHSAWLLRRWHLNRYESRYGTYFSRLFPVVLFMFALFSVMLSAMQVILAAKQLWETDNKGLKKILDLFVWFGTESIAWSLAFALLFVIWFILISSFEGVKRRSTQHKTEKRFKAEGLNA